MEPLPDYGDLMPMSDFIETVKCGCFIDYDGYGKYSDGKEMSEQTVRPSDVEAGKVDMKWSHVVWFNR
jgi:hypothetical protein